MANTILQLKIKRMAGIMNYGNQAAPEVRGAKWLKNGHGEEIYNIKLTGGPPMYLTVNSSVPDIIRKWRSMILIVLIFLFRVPTTYQVLIRRLTGIWE